MDSSIGERDVQSQGQQDRIHELEFKVSSMEAKLKGDGEELATKERKVL